MDCILFFFFLLRVTCTLTWDQNLTFPLEKKFFFFFLVISTVALFLTTVKYISKMIKIKQNKTPSYINLQLNSKSYISQSTHYVGE